MITRFSAALLVSSLVIVSSAQPQFVQDPLDQGEADTVRMVFTLLPDANTSQWDVSMDLYVFNDQQNLNGTSLGFRWANDNLLMTNAYLSPLGDDAFDIIRFLYRSNSIDSTNKYHQFQLTTSRMFTDGILAGSVAKHLATYEFTLSDWTIMDSLVFDTVKVLGATFVLVDYDNNEYQPYWDGRIVIYDANRPILSNLVLSEDTLYFQAIQGQANPAPQTVEITSDRDPVTFSLVEDVSWLLKSPSGGTPPQTVSVSVTTVGLTPDVYFDSVRIDAPDAVNSPQFLWVSLEVTPPPPVISVTPAQFGFSAVAGGSDPASQILNISNDGGSTLSWAVSRKSSWLGLNPVSGSGAGAVTVSASIAGLGIGDYFDTITVSDPAATNSPVRVPVRLTIASDLPLIEVIEPLNQLVQPFYGPLIDPLTFEIRNAGGGTLSYIIGYPGSPLKTGRIVAVEPRQGTAPQIVSVYFEYPVWGYDITFLDTLWVQSGDAANSPVRVVFEQRVLKDPAVISVPPDPVVLTVYECAQGYGNNMPQAYVPVENAGGDDPMWVEVEYESDLFEVVNRYSLEFAPETLMLRALPTDRPLGVYHDTIWVTSTWALNKPQPVAVVYDYRAGDETPEIVADPSPVEIAYRADSGPMPLDEFRIYNLYGGCMPWTITGTPAWLTATVTDGDVPQPCPLLVEASGLDVGEYHADLIISAPSAVNSPLNVDCVLKVWKLRGDVNWNGRITVQDVAWMIDYIFEEEHAPLPTLEVGDVDCNGQVNVADIVLVVEYLFETLTPLCDNPY